MPERNCLIRRRCNNLGLVRTAACPSSASPYRCWDFRLVCSDCLIARRSLLPVVTMPGLLIAVVEQRAHVARIEWLRQLHSEILANIGEVVADTILEGGVIHSHDVVISTGGYHGGDGTRRDTHRAALDDRPFGIKPGVSNDVGV